MNEKQLEIAIEAARRAADKSIDYKSEVFLAVALTELLRASGTSPEATTTALAVVRDKQRPPAPKPFSASEFFYVRVWSSEIDKVLLAGAFLEAHGGLPSYTNKQVRDCLVSAKVSVPKNISLALFRAVQRGLMMEVPGGNGRGKVWALTQTGVQRAAAMTKAS
jgi:hypothetical protein